MFYFCKLLVPALPTPLPQLVLQIAKNVLQIKVLLFIRQKNIAFSVLEIPAWKYQVFLWSPFGIMIVATSQLGVDISQIRKIGLVPLITPGYPTFSCCVYICTTYCPEQKTHPLFDCFLHFLLSLLVRSHANSFVVDLYLNKFIHCWPPSVCRIF